MYRTEISKKFMRNISECKKYFTLRRMDILSLNYCIIKARLLNISERKG